MNYSGEFCPVCGKAFLENEDIVVCPECGTPHHRKCWEENGKCMNSHVHGEFSWQPSAEPVNEQTEEKSTEKRICPKCSEENSPDAKFCDKCGFPLSAGNFNFNMSAQLPPIYFEGEQVNYEDEIDGCKISEIAKFVRMNYIKYIQKFLKVAKKKLTFNWAAFFFNPYWYFYRKLYYIGGIFIGIELAVTLITSVLLTKLGLTGFMEEFAQLYSNAASSAELQAFLQTAQPAATKLVLISLISFIPKIISGFIADRVYKKNTVKTLKFLKNPAEIQSTKFKIVSTGGVSILSGLISVLALSMITELLSLL